MNKLNYIIAHILLALSAFLSSCNKELNSGNYNGSVTVKFSINLKDETNTRSYNQFDDISVWVYEMGNNADDGRLPVAYITKTGLNSNTTTVRINVPVSDVEKTYRVFAIANKDGLGYVKNLRLTDQLSYKELSTAVFDAECNKITQMPFTHWKDIILSSEGEPVKEENILLYRPVAKTELYAKLSEEISDVFSINKVTVQPKQIAVPINGGVFSDAESSRLDTLRTPSTFASYSSYSVGIAETPLCNSYDQNDNILSFREVNIGTTEKLVGSAYLYENHHGELYMENNTADYLSTDNYPNGAYYMAIGYDISGENGICYIPLPKTVRNNNYKVNATFDIDLAGNLVLNYRVENWIEVTEELEFRYPTITISAVATRHDGDELVPDYSQPIMHYNTSFNYSGGKAPAISDGAFAFFFEMEESTVDNRAWTVHYNEYTQNDGEWSLDADQSDDFLLAVCDTDGNIQKEENGNYKYTYTPEGKKYEIRIYPKKNKSAGTVKAADIYITYPASWLGGQSDELLINAGGGGTLWSNSGGERYKIRVVQGDDI